MKYNLNMLLLKPENVLIIGGIVNSLREANNLETILKQELYVDSFLVGF